MEYTILDVREPEEYARGHIAKAINIPSASLMAGAPELKDMPKNTPLLVYCQTGSRSKIAIELFKKMGFTHLINGINQHIAQERFGLG